MLLEHTRDTDQRIRKVLDVNQELPPGAGIDHYLKNIKHSRLGNPVQVNFYGNKICIDYSLSIREMFFMGNTVIDASVVLEVGAGFGRLAHSILANFNNVSKYYIVDLDWMLNFSRAYLERVLDRHLFEKLVFVPTSGYQNIEPNRKIDLVINIDSFQEMEPLVATDYLDFIGKRASSFYCKNAIGKYSPESINLEVGNSEQHRSAMKMGLCTDIVDIFNTQELEKATKKYLEIFKPRGFFLQKHEPEYGQYNFYHSALYSEVP